MTGRRMLAELCTRLGVREAEGSAESVVAVCARCGGAHGRPVVAGLAASVSHSHGSTAVALAPASAGGWSAGGGIGIGIDLEIVPRAASGERVRALEDVTGGRFRDLRAALERWTAVEAVLKADGRGLDVDPRSVILTPEGSGAAARSSARIADRPGERYDVDRIDIGRSAVLTLARRTR